MSRGIGICSVCGKHILIYNDEGIAITAKKVGKKWICQECKIGVKK